MDKIKKMKELIEEINRHNYNYYTLMSPTISDAEYDKLYYALVDLEEEVGIVLENSPTKRVGNFVLLKAPPPPAAGDGEGERGGGEDGFP